MDIQLLRSTKDQLDQAQYLITQAYEATDDILHHAEQLKQPPVGAYSLDYKPAHPWASDSKRHMYTLHPDLIYICNRLADVFNCSVIWGFRGQQAQMKAYHSNNGLKWPDSKHNVMPSRAVDIVPYPLHWDDTESFALLIGGAMAIAKQAEIPIRLGKDFKVVGADGIERGPDWPHIELI